MNTDRVYELRRVVRGESFSSEIVADAADSLQELADALEISERQRKDLEAQAAVLATVLDKYELLVQQFHAAAYDDPDMGTVQWEHKLVKEWDGLKATLANLPAAVQAHLERDKRLKRLAEAVAQMPDLAHHALPHIKVREDVYDAVMGSLAAYRAAGGEVGE